MAELQEGFKSNACVWGRIEWCLLACIAFIAFLWLPPGVLPMPRLNEPVADIYNSHIKLHARIVAKVDEPHEFPNGTTQEGWLVRTEYGPDLWFPASKLRRVITENR